MKLRGNGDLSSFESRTNFSISFSDRFPFSLSFFFSETRGVVEGKKGANRRGVKSIRCPTVVQYILQPRFTLPSPSLLLSSRAPLLSFFSSLQDENFGETCVSFTDSKQGRTMNFPRSLSSLFSQNRFEIDLSYDLSNQKEE